MLMSGLNSKSISVKTSPDEIRDLDVRVILNSEHFSVEPLSHTGGCGGKGNLSPRVRSDERDGAE